jgi:uncharacterized protein YciI
MHYLLIYDLADDYVERRGALRLHHLTQASEAVARGELILGGALNDPVDQAYLLFDVKEPGIVEEFARNDIYVTEGLVTSWRVREWTTVVGPQAATKPKL